MRAAKPPAAEATEYTMAGLVAAIALSTEFAMLCHPTWRKTHSDGRCRLSGGRYYIERGYARKHGLEPPCTLRVSWKLTNKQILQGTPSFS